jgi:hypothetical protein
MVTKRQTTEARDASKYRGQTASQVTQTAAVRHVVLLDCLSELYRNEFQSKE